jgi:hypothetical protein
VVLCIPINLITLNPKVIGDFSNEYAMQANPGGRAI